MTHRSPAWRGLKSHLTQLPYWTTSLALEDEKTEFPVDETIFSQSTLLTGNRAQIRHETKDAEVTKSLAYFCHQDRDSLSHLDVVSAAIETGNFLLLQRNNKLSNPAYLHDHIQSLK